MKGEVREAVARGVVIEYVSGWNSHDAPRLAALFREDGSYGDFGEGKVFLGRDEIERTLSDFFYAVPDLALTLTSEPASDGDRALCRWTISGTQTGALWGLPATGRTFRVEGSTMFVLRDGQIERAAVYYSVRSVTRQLKFRLSPEAAARPSVTPPRDIVAPPEFPPDEDNIGYGE
ncbi:MAG: ester cyclase [Dehalococcoidia bacterium]|nr:ester cyclase [Dehalococcoidia bacterium]